MNITGTSASSQLPAGTASCGAKWAVDPTPSDTPSTTNSTSAETLRLASTLLTIRPGPTPRTCTHDMAAITTIAVKACGEMVSGTNGSGTVSERGAIRRDGREPADVIGEHDGAHRDRAGEAGDERCPPGEECRERAERGVQVHVLAAGARTHRGQLRVRHRTGEREQAAGQPREQEPPRVRHAGGHLRRGEQDAAADDVRDDDRGRVERTEASLERGKEGSGAAAADGWSEGTSVGQQLALDLVFTELHPGRRRVLAEDLRP